MLSSAPIAMSGTAAATAAMPAMSSAGTGCSKKSSPAPATARTYCIASSLLQPWLASEEISASDPRTAQTRRVRSLSTSGLSMPTLILNAVKPSAFWRSASRRSEASSPVPMTPRMGMRLRLAAEQRVGRLAGGAADEIVQRHFDGGLAAVLPYIRAAIAVSVPAMFSAGRPSTAGVR